MTGFLGNAVLWVKAVHIISMVAWMAGLLYLPRLFVYHSSCEPEAPQWETFCVMERRLLRVIMNPAIIVAFLSGVLLLVDQWSFIWSQGWWYPKLFSVIVLIVFHHHLAAVRKRFATGDSGRGARHYRLINEIPTVFLIVIVIMVVVKPF